MRFLRLNKSKISYREELRIIIRYFSDGEMESCNAKKKRKVGKYINDFL